MSRPEIDLHLQSSSDDERQVIVSWLSSLNFRASHNEFIQEMGPESGSSNLGNLRSGMMGHLKCYGAQEMVRLSLSLDRTSSLVNE